MAKRPAFQFYPSDWRNDPGLRLCSTAARGLWMDMLCLMHEGEPYGHLTVLGRPMTPDSLAKLVGEGAASTKRWLEELRENDVFSVSDTGLIYSRRMARDEALREVRANGGKAGAEHGLKGAAHGAKGGRPRKEDAGYGDGERGDKKPPLEPPPSSSSSASASKEDSEDKSSASLSLADPDALTWSMVRLLLEDRAGMKRPQVGPFFGNLLAKNGLAARDMLPAVSAATINGTQDPKSYLAKAAEHIAKRRVGEKPKAVGFV